MIKIMFVSLALVVAFTIWAAWAMHRQLTCHGQCPHDRMCQQRCFTRGDCPASSTLDIEPAVLQ